MVSWAIASAESEWVDRWAVGDSLFAVSARGLCKSALTAFEMRAVEDFWTRVGRALEQRCAVGSDVFQCLCCASAVEANAEVTLCIASAVGSDAFQCLCCASAVEANAEVILCIASAVRLWRCAQGYQDEAGVLAATGCVFPRLLA